MAVPFKLNRPPIDNDPNLSWVMKKWLNDVHQYTVKNGILVPAGGRPGNQPSIYGGRRNIVDNGDFQVWQRGTSITSTGGSDYTCDRWAITRAAGTQIVSRQTAGLTGFQYCARVERSAADAAANNLYLAQAIPTVIAVPLAGQTVTLSYWVRTGSGFAGTLTAQLQSGTGTDQGPVAGFTGGLLESVQSITANTVWTYYQNTVTLTTTTNELKVYFQNTPPAVAGANNYFEVTGVQLEVGDRASTFDFMPFQTQVGICKYYYQKSFPYGTAPAQNAGAAGCWNWANAVAGAVAGMGPSLRFNPSMRTTPTVTFYNPSAANAFARNFSTGTNATATAANGLGEDGMGVSATGLAAWAVNNLIGVNWAATADL